MSYTGRQTLNTSIVLCVIKGGGQGTQTKYLEQNQG